MHLVFVWKFINLIKNFDDSFNIENDDVIKHMIDEKILVN